MPICMTARYEVPRERLEDCRRTVAEFVKYIRANEPHTLFYTALQDKSNDASFLHIMIFEDDRAITLHQNSPATRRFVETIYPAALEPLEFHEHNVLGFKAEGMLNGDA